MRVALAGRSYLFTADGIPERVIHTLILEDELSGCLLSQGPSGSARSLLLKRNSRGGTRTPDPVINSHLLYQLSYSGKFILAADGISPEVPEGSSSRITARLPPNRAAHSGPPPSHRLSALPGHPGLREGSRRRSRCLAPRWERASRDGEGWEEQPIQPAAWQSRARGEQKPWEIPRKGVFKCSFPCARICASW